MTDPPAALAGRTSLSHKLRLQSRDGTARVKGDPSIHKHHGLAAVEDDAILEMMTHRARQHAAFDIAALARQIIRRVAMADALDVLIDDRPLIERAGDVMGGGADQLDAALMRLMVG